jgi:hypothetical protein
VKRPSELVLITTGAHRRTPRRARPRRDGRGRRCAPVVMSTSSDGRFTGREDSWMVREVPVRRLAITGIRGYGESEEFGGYRVFGACL